MMEAQTPERIMSPLHLDAGIPAVSQLSRARKS